MRSLVPSRFPLYQAGLLGLAVALSGCSLRLHPPPAPQAIHSVNTGGGCLSQAGDVFDRFEKGNLSAADHDAFYDCAHKALNTFQNYVVGQNQGYFEPSELGSFLSKYFLNGKPIQPGLLAEAMALKVALVGGAPDRLTHDDLTKIIAFCQSLRSLTTKMRPLMPFTADSFLARGLSGDEFERALSTFTSATADFGRAQKSDQGPYPFARLSALISELQKFLYPDGVPTDHWTVFVLHAVAALPSVKEIMISPPQDEIAPADWARIYQLTPRYYASYLRVSFYLRSPFASFEANGIDTLEKLFRDFTGTFDFVLDQHPGGQITSDEIDEVVQALSQNQILPPSVSPATARQFINVLFGRILGGAGPTAKFAVTKDSLSRFTENIHYLLEGAHALEALYRPRFGDQFTTGSLSAAEIAAVPDATLIAKTLLKNALSAQAVADLKATPGTIHTVFPGTADMVLVPATGLPDRFSFVHLLKIHALRSLNRLLLEGYGTPGANAFTPDQINQFVADVFPVLTDFQLVTNATEAQVPKLLTEATLFMYSSQGGPNLTMNEAIEMEAITLSSLVQAPTVQGHLAAACNVAQVKDKSTGKIASPVIPADCYRQQFMAHYDKIWKYLPGLAKYVGALSPADRLKLFDAMNFLHKAPSSGPDVYTVSDTDVFLQMPYYVELLFSRFDANGDGLLDNKEAAVAYPVFEPFIQTKATALGYTSQKDFSAIYNFLLAYREIPTADKWTYAERRYLLGDKAFTDDRAQVTQIFTKLLSF